MFCEWPRVSDQLSVFDEALCQILSRILNVDLDQDTAWLQATLPVYAGGLGVRRAVQLAPSAFLASAAGCSSLIQHILQPCSLTIHDPCIKLVISLWSQGHDGSPPSHPISAQQRAWDAPRIEATFNHLLDVAHNQQAKSRLLAAACPESGAWLNALPIPLLGLQMDDDVVRIAAGLHLGLSICRPHHCASCGSSVDSLGVHSLSCRFSKGCHYRHMALNDIIKRSLESVKVPCHLEPTGLYCSDGKRPDGASVVPWKEGKILVWDATCSDTLVPSHSTLAEREAGAVTNDAKHRKRAKYAHLDSSHFFVPVAVETMGVLGREADCFLREVARQIEQMSDDRLAHQYLLQCVSVAVQRGNAASVLGCMGGQVEVWIS